MAEPLSTSATVGTVAGWCIVTSALVAFITSVDYSIAFGAFAGSMCFIVTASDLTRRQIFGYFLFGYAAGIYGAGFVADKVEDYLEYREKRLDALAAGQSLCRIMCCVIARSAKAKRMGIKMAAPLFKNERFFRENGVHVFSSNYELY
ncbi:putative holin [Pantoea agglomerans]